MNKTMFRLVLTGLVLTLAACGFKLREEIALPAQLVKLRIEVVDTFSPLQRDLEQALRRAGATITTAQDSAVLRVPAHNLERLPLSIGESGRVQEFLLRYRTEVELIDPAGVVLLPRQSVTLERDFTFDTQQAFGTPREEEMVRAELEREMVQAILRRIDAAIR